MMPSYHNSSWSVLFFVVYLSVALYVLMNLLLAVVYSTYSSLEKKKFKNLFLHKREAASRAFFLLCQGQVEFSTYITYSDFKVMMKYFKPRHSPIRVLLQFKALNKSRSGFLSLEEFYNIYNVIEFKWKKIQFAADVEEDWFVGFCYPFHNCFKGIQWLVSKKYFEFFIYFVIIANGAVFIGEIIMITRVPPKERKEMEVDVRWYEIMFLSIYVAELILKILGFGVKGFFRNSWNVFDFIVIMLSVVGALGKKLGNFGFSFVACLRPLRLLLLFRVKQRFRDMLDAMVVLFPRMVNMSVVVLLVFYFFAVIGMECYAGLPLRNCCKNTSVEINFSDNGYYYLNSFDNFGRATVTLFELTVVNNWFIIMDGFVFVTSSWSRVYFMSFYIVAFMVFMNIVIAFILEAFLFRIEYRSEHPTEDDQRIIRIETYITALEIRQVDPELLSDLSPEEQPRLHYCGERRRNKGDLSLVMYEDEVKVWCAEQDARCVLIPLLML